MASSERGNLERSEIHLSRLIGDNGEHTMAVSGVRYSGTALLDLSKLVESKNIGFAMSRATVIKLVSSMNADASPRQIYLPRHGYDGRSG